MCALEKYIFILFLFRLIQPDSPGFSSDDPWVHFSHRRANAAPERVVLTERLPRDRGAEEFPTPKTGNL